MRTLTINNAVARRQVTCQTLDNDHILVDIDLLRLSRTFKNMCDDLGLEEHHTLPGVFPVEAVRTRIFEKVIDWCKEHKGDPEPVVEKDPLTQECKWFEFSRSERRFFEVPMSELLELVMAASYLDIHGLYHYACQAVAARIKGKSPRKICQVLRQHCDHHRTRIWKIRADNPWLHLVSYRARIKNPTFIPNEVLVTIFEKLPRKDLERLKVVSTQFNGIIESSSRLSEQQGPLRVVAKVEFEGHLQLFRVRHRPNSIIPRFSQIIDVWLPDGIKTTCADYEDLANRLKFATVLKMRVGHGAICVADVQDLSPLLPVKSAWKNATVEASMACFPFSAVFEFAFTQLFMCKEIIVDRGHYSRINSLRPHMRLPAIMSCNTLDISRLNLNGDLVLPSDVVEWLEHEVAPENKWSEPREIILHEGGITGGIHELLTALKTAFLSASSPRPYVVCILLNWDGDDMNDELANDKTHEVLSIRTEQNKAVLVKRA